MTSVIKVDSIQNSSGTSALSIDSSGNVATQQAMYPKGLSYWPAFVAGFSRDPSDWIGVGSNDLVAFDTTSGTDAFDNGSNFNTSTSLFTAPVDGLYRFDFNVYTLENNTVSQFRFKKDGVNWGRIGGGDSTVTMTIQDSGAADNTMMFSAMMQLTAGGTVGVYSSSNSSRLYTGSTFFMGCLIA